MKHAQQHSMVHHKVRQLSAELGAEQKAALSSALVLPDFVVYHAMLLSMLHDTAQQGCAHFLEMLPRKLSLVCLAGLVVL